ncbi:MAG: plastocyanin/azurin family copper-binding protein [Bacteroidota bacterium]
MPARWFALTVFLATLPSLGQAQPVQLSIAAVEGLQYAPMQLVVAPGDEVVLTMDNPSSMIHNWLLVAPEQRMNVVEAAMALGAAGPEQEYIPESNAVLAALGEVAPGEAGEVRFTAPTEAGVYPFVCTYPGHGFVMYGALYVTDDPTTVPSAADDPNLPSLTRVAEAVAPHPFIVEYPALYRTFVPDASPAAIVVSLDGDLSFCWDASYSHLQYAWAGGFVDNTAHWSGNGKYLTELIGTRFYQQRAGFPFRLDTDEDAPEVEFLGYRLTDRLPTFRYAIGEVMIEETITAGEAPRSLVRTFEVGGHNGPVAFVTEASEGVRYDASAGSWDEGVLRLSSDQAQQFSITMTAEED